MSLPIMGAAQGEASCWHCGALAFSKSIFPVGLCLPSRPCSASSLMSEAAFTAGRGLCQLHAARSRRCGGSRPAADGSAKWTPYHGRERGGRGGCVSSRG